jgi:alpha-glucosidase
MLIVIMIKTSKVTCIITKNDLKVSIYDLDGFAILEDEIGFHWEESYEFGGNIVKMSKNFQRWRMFLWFG